MSHMAVELGLRERKKQQTRQLIADAAWRLFLERGFDQVPVADVAREADVSEATVYNYFPTKEDLVYHRMEAFEEELLSAIAQRPAGESIVDAFGRFALKPRGLLSSSEKGADEGLAAINRMMTRSPALLAREQLIFERYTRTLAELIARERGMGVEDPEPWVVANALLGLHRALIDYVRRRVLAGDDRRLIARGMRAHGKRALALLAHGLDQRV